MVETRNIRKTATLPTVEVERTQHESRAQSPSGVRLASSATPENVSALPTTSGTQPMDTVPDTAQFCPVNRPDLDARCCHPREGSAQTPAQRSVSCCSRQATSELSQSSCSSATVRAQKLTIEAEALRCRLGREREIARQQAEREREIARQQAERELELARLETEAEQTELQAKLAALEARDKSIKYRSSCSSKKRTASWVLEQNVNMTSPMQTAEHGEVRTVTLGIPDTYVQSTVPTNAVPLCAPYVNHERYLQQPTQLADNSVAVTHTGQLPDLPLADPIAKLAQAITGLSNKPKKPELVAFSGEIDQWMAFKSDYDRSKCHFSPAENLARLNHAIRGLAYQSVASLLWTSRDPEDVIQALEQTYARPELLVAREVAALRTNSKLSSPEDLNALANRLRNFVTTIKLLKQDDYLFSPELFRCVLLKLSEHTRARFTDFATNLTPLEQNSSKLNLLSRFLLIEADKQLKFNFIPDSTVRSQNPSPFFKFIPKKETIHATSSPSSSKVQDCTYCKQGTHSIKTCKAFLSLALDDRWRWVRELKLCYRCLKSNPHTWNNCKAKRCGVNGCTRRHNSLLHGTEAPNAGVDATSQACVTQTQPMKPIVHVDKGTLNKENEPSVTTANTSDFLFMTGAPTSQPRGLLKVLPIVIEGPNGKYETTALLDEGSTATLIDGEVAARIGVKPTRQECLRIEGVGGMSKMVHVSYVNFYIRGRNLRDRYLVEHARAISPLGLRSQNSERINLENYVHLSDLSDELSLSGVAPTVLIGAPDWHLSISREVRRGKKNEPVASKTLLGWVLHGAFSVSSKPIEFLNHVCDDLDVLIKSQYDIDSLGITKNVPRPNIDDQRAIDIIETSAHRLHDGRFEIGLPWKKDLPKNIPDSYPQALSRFKALERQMAKDISFAEAYRRFIADIISKGYAEECDPETFHKRSPLNGSCVGDEGSFRWYLPTFGVFHPQKKKLRVVHDAAAATKGVSLNSMLLQGPDLLCSLLDMLFRFREGAVALNADIKEMFPQVKIAPRDRDAQWFLWRNIDGNIVEYRMASMIFGAVSSPFIALYLKNKNAKQFADSFPAACQAIQEDHYMDDFLGSHTNVADAAQLATDIITVHKKCCFEMRAWTSNIPEALSGIPKELRSDTNSDVYLPPNNEVGVLGVKWNPSNDTLSFRGIPQTPTNNILTKRGLLSSVMKVYDPLGLVMPIIIWGRILIQRLWREGIDWDSPMPDKYIADCQDWFVQLQGTISIKIPRWYMNKQDPTDTQLHLLSDGGEQGYACVAYWRFTYADSSVSTALIGSKARVAPLKPLSIPRLELQAALIATRFAQTILHAHRLKPSSVTFWTDSTTVLKWIRTDARVFKPFVAHRLGEMLETTSPSNWRWIPTSLNVADDATKPKKLNLSPSHRWFTGPSFFLEPPHTWPTEPTTDPVEISPDIEIKSEHVGLLVDTAFPDPPVPISSRFSSWLRLLRATARVIQGARLFRSKTSRPIDSKLLNANDTTSPSLLSASDMIHAETLLLQRAQIDSFLPEIKALQAKQYVDKNSRIAKLAPVLDEESALRLDSRIKSAPGVSEAVKSPMILDGRHHTVRLLILHHHIQSSHCLNELVLNELRQRYWILRARNTIRSVADVCLQCRKWKVKSSQPRTGDLLPERLDHHKRPFTHTGLDYFGPITIIIRRSNEKRYVALYTCLVTRAIHLELVASLSSDAAIMSLRRFIARRGSPSTIFSDNGTNFVGAARELRSLHHESVQEFATNHKIQWRFIPPASPFMGGAWERLVRSVKTALRACLNNRTIKEDVPTTLLLEAESIINSRPLTYITSAPDTPEALTPFHFILGTSSVAPWTSSLTDRDLMRRCDWRRTLRLADHFWSRWLREYLPTLRPRGLPGSETMLSEGDVVLIADPTLPRGLWPLGRVTKTFIGPDGTVRVADIQTKGGTLRRPARKLILLEPEPQPVATSC